MKQLFSLFKLAGRARVSTSLINFTPQRGVRYDSKIVWKEPEKYKNHHPLRTGDTAAVDVNLNEIYYKFKRSIELETADEKVKKILSLKYQKLTHVHDHYKQELIEKVREHPLDNSSTPVIIARFTAQIRNLQKVLNGPKTRFHRKLHDIVESMVRRRKKHLKRLRIEDYKKFEWLLETLELQYRPGVHLESRKLQRKNEIVRLAKLRVEKMKEEKLAALRKLYDEQKVPFLEQKIEKLKLIQEKEKKFDLEPTVTDEDIKQCMEQLEKVKIQVEENAKNGYLMKVHPFLLEPYNENLLREKETSGALIREKLEPKQPKTYSGTSPS